MNFDLDFRTGDLRYELFDLPAVNMNLSSLLCMTILFISFYVLLSGRKKLRKKVVPLEGGVNGVGGVGYGASGTGIVKLTEVVLS